MSRQRYTLEFKDEAVRQLVKCITSPLAIDSSKHRLIRRCEEHSAPKDTLRKRSNLQSE